MTASDLWPLPWVSPVHASNFIALLFVVVLQATTGLILWNLVRPGRIEPQRPTPWEHFTVGAVFPLAVAWMAIRWLGIPVAATRLESALWPGWLTLVLGVLTLTISAVVSRTQRFGRHRRTILVVAALGGILAVASRALILSFQVDPGAWLDFRVWRTALTPPPFPMILLVQAAGITSLGAALALFARIERDRISRAIRAVATASSAVGCVVVVSSSWWLSSNVMTNAAQLASEQGINGPAWTSRWMIVTISAWASFAFATTLVPRKGRPWAPFALALLAITSSQALWDSYRGPWHVRGWIYDNGLDFETSRTKRRSTFTNEASDHRGEHMFRQCASCHASNGPLSVWRDALGCDAIEIRGRLESLREADRIDHPDRNRMPPLMGSDQEVDALATWLRSGQPCP